jgi:hypothetical protein
MRSWLKRYGWINRALPLVNVTVHDAVVDLWGFVSSEGKHEALA